MPGIPSTDVCRNDGTSPWRSSLSLLPPRLHRCRRGLHNGPDLAGEQSQIAARGGVFCYVPAIPLLVPDKQLLATDLLQKKMGSWQGRRKRMANRTAKTYRSPSISAGGGIRCQNDGR